MTSPALQHASNEYTATEKEVAAAQLMFEAAVIRGDPTRIQMATDAAHAAMQNRLDAFASLIAVARRDVGGGT